MHEPGVHIALLRTQALRELPEDRLDELASGVPSTYRNRWFDAGLHVDRRFEALGTGLMLSSMLLDRPYMSFLRAPTGRPCLVDDSGSFCMACSISHAGGVCALATSRDAEAIGVDVERVCHYDRVTARRVFDESRIAWIEDVSGQEDVRFTCAWTQLEAVLKARGTGFAVDPREVDVFEGYAVDTQMWDGHVAISVGCAGDRKPLVELEDVTDALLRAWNVAS